MSATTINNLIEILIQSVADCLGGEYNLTSDDVPRIIFTTEDGTNKISVVYLASSNQWKAFYPFPAAVQSKEYFKNIRELIEWLYSKGVTVL